MNRIKARPSACNEEMIHQAIGEIHAEYHQQNQHRRLENFVLNRTLANFDDIDPAAVRGCQIVLVLDALGEIAQIFLVD